MSFRFSVNANGYYSHESEPQPELSAGKLQIEKKAPDLSNSTARLVVLLATYNGESFLEAQLRSLEEQTLETFDIVISDDGSTDRTLEIANAFVTRWGRGRAEVISHVNDPSNSMPYWQIRSTNNFLHMMEMTSDTYDLVAFCDQDDIWLPDKLERALEWISHQDPGLPTVYCSAVKRIDQHGSPIANRNMNGFRPAFANALVQNIVAGNTAVLNKKAASLMTAAAARASFVCHDWMAYLLVTGSGGICHYDEKPSLLYRMHGDNQLLSALGVRTTMNKLAETLKGKYKVWNTANLRAMQENTDLLEPDAQQLVVDLVEVKRKNCVSGTISLMRSGVHRQSSVGQMSLYLSRLVGKF